jgi:DNA repair protein RecO (recombination protein O)
VAELLGELTDSGDPHRELFQAADAALLALDQGAPLTETVLKFELVALQEAGHSPSLDQCVACGRIVDVEKRVPFDMAAGGVLCGECRPGRRGVVSVSSGVIAALRQMSGVGDMGTAGQASRGTENQTNEKNGSGMLHPAIRGELRAVMSHYFAHLIGHRLRMSEYLVAPPNP